METELKLCPSSVDELLLKCCLERILSLYECLSRITSESPDCLLVRLWTHKCDDTLQLAQDYLLTVISEYPAYERCRGFPADTMATLFALRTVIEREAKVFMRFTENEVLLKGPQLQVDMAMQLLDEQMLQTQGLKQSHTVDSLLSEAVGTRHERTTKRIESEDSSYDSDTESGLGHGHKGHDDVTRTVSDTLAAEFAEYVTHKADLKTVLADPSYQTRLEFAVKLGYTEAQVQTALQRLGLSTSNNELLAELIKLSSTTKEDPLEAAVDFNAISRATELRPVVIDGSNVAMSHGNKEVFSCKGIKICVDWFRGRGHKEITVFVPSWRKETARPNTPITDQEVLLQLEREKVLVFTPSRNVNGKRLVCYEDRYILKLAAGIEGIVVSNDNYRDLVLESSEFKKVVEERLLMYTFVNDRFMPPDDPLGRTGPTLDLFLRKPSSMLHQTPPVCPYAKKCTYGNKCKYYHPERGNMPQKSIIERLAEQAKLQMQEVKSRGHPGTTELIRTRSVPVTSAGDLSLAGGVKKKQALSRTRSAAPPLRPQDDYLGQQNYSPDALWRHSSWSNLQKTMLSESGHLSLAKKLSDPDSRSQSQLEDSENIHKKLQRQLTLNPNYDDRLTQMRLVNNPNRHRHPNAARLTSDNYMGGNTGFGGGDGMWHGLSGVNSTSDTKLNLFPNQFVTPTCYQPTIWSPIPNQQAVRPSSVPPPQHRPRAPCMMSPMQKTPSMGSGTNHLQGEDPRYKLYYHLTSIFPEDQVKVAMDRHPEELNPQKICATIIAMFPPKP